MPLHSRSTKLVILWQPQGFQLSASGGHKCPCSPARRREGASPARRAARAHLALEEFPLQGGRILFTPSVTSGDEEDQLQPRSLGAAAAGDAAGSDDLPQVGGHQSETAVLKRYAAMRW